MIEERDRLLTKYKRSRGNNDWEEYRVMRNFVTNAIRQEKRGYLNHVRRTGDSKKLWNSLRGMNVYNRSNHMLPASFNDPDLVNLHFIDAIKK